MTEKIYLVVKNKLELKTYTVADLDETVNPNKKSKYSDQATHVYLLPSASLNDNQYANPGDRIRHVDTSNLNVHSIWKTPYAARQMAAALGKDYQVAPLSLYQNRDLEVGLRSVLDKRAFEQMDIIKSEITFAADDVDRVVKTIGNIIQDRIEKFWANYLDKIKQIANQEDQISKGAVDPFDRRQEIVPEKDYLK